MIASALFVFYMGIVIAVDWATFAIAFVTLLFFHIPEVSYGKSQEKLLAEAKSGMDWLRATPAYLSGSALEHMTSPLAILATATPTLCYKTEKLSQMVPSLFRSSWM